MNKNIFDIISEDTEVALTTAILEIDEDDTIYPVRLEGSGWSSLDGLVTVGGESLCSLLFEDAEVGQVVKVKEGIHLEGSATDNMVGYVGEDMDAFIGDICTIIDLGDGFLLLKHPTTDDEYWFAFEDLDLFFGIQDVFEDDFEAEESGSDCATCECRDTCPDSDAKEEPKDLSDLKKGDLVLVKDMERPWYWNRQGEMDYLLGKWAVVDDTCAGGVYVYDPYADFSWALSVDDICDVRRR